MRNKIEDPAFWIILLAGSAFIGFVTNFIWNADTRFSELQQRVVALELQGARQSRISVIKIGNPKPSNQVHQQIFQQLQLINRVQSTQDVEKPKRILVSKNILKIQDPEVAREDPFYDLLGLLLDEAWVEQLTLPNAPDMEASERAFYRSIRQELVRFGLDPEKIQNIPERRFEIILKQAL
jgi:hypothetical protein